MHEYAKGLKFPILDVEEIVRLRFLGYDQMKVVSNLNEANGENGLGDFGGRHPDTFTNFFFKGIYPITCATYPTAINTFFCIFPCISIFEIWFM